MVLRRCDLDELLHLGKRILRHDIYSLYGIGCVTTGFVLDLWKTGQYDDEEDKTVLASVV